MSAPILELEGTWEEILEHGPELKGRRVKLTTISEEKPNGMDGRHKRMLAEYRVWIEDPARVEELPLLDATEHLLRENRLTFREFVDSE